MLLLQRGVLFFFFFFFFLFFWGVYLNQQIIKTRATAFTMTKHLPVGLSHALNLVLLLDCIAVGGALGSVDELLSEALSDGLDVAEGCFACTGGEEPDSHVDAAHPC